VPVDAYTLVLASFLLPAGSTADRIGRKRIFQIGLVAFGIGSLLCGLSALTAGLRLLPVGVLITLLSPYSSRSPRWRSYSRCTCFSASFRAPSTRLSPIPPSRACPARWRGATSLASSGRQTGTTLCVAIAGTIVGSVSGGTAFTDFAHGVWWLVFGLGLAILAMGLISTTTQAKNSAARAATLFEEVDQGIPTLR